MTPALSSEVITDGPSCGMCGVYFFVSRRMRDPREHHQGGVICERCYAALMADRLDPGGTIEDHDELPGMWDRADFTGGRHG